MPTRVTPVPQESKRDQQKRVSVWGMPNDVVYGSSYGDIKFRKWCDLEMARFNKKRDAKGRPENVRIITHKSGYIALSR